MKPCDSVSYVTFQTESHGFIYIEASYSIVLFTYSKSTWHSFVYLQQKHMALFTYDNEISIPLRMRDLPPYHLTYLSPYSQKPKQGLTG